MDCIRCPFVLIIQKWGGNFPLGRKHWGQQSHYDNMVHSTAPRVPGSLVMGQSNNQKNHNILEASESLLTGGAVQRHSATVCRKLLKGQRVWMIAHQRVLDFPSLLFVFSLYFCYLPVALTLCMQCGVRESLQSPNHYAGSAPLQECVWLNMCFSLSIFD